MARKLEVKLLDDIDGSEADETLKFGLDGTNYEIDVNAKHAEQLRASLAKFVLGARRLGRGGITTTRRPRAAATNQSDRAQNQAIRDWAKRRNIQLSGRGRIPRHIAEQYEAEAGR
ncbi:histone-like nucleoid-structuring protein Lsr2 [Rugosimonospora africana]|uniref:Lsr2 family protein n=1 Tax=Rugosimonospora africana TaxID=556532 RepID=A0A8J3VPY9_9ACTN|nr:Lsr2 family protein [Rugosimonospora africana]GIH14442.1 Lsr2 family protein [Rugosimonospora africana]